MIGLFEDKLKSLIVLFLLLSHGLMIQAQVLKINAHLDSTTILIGDQVKLHIDVDLPASAKVVFPVFSDTLTSKIKIVRAFPVDTIRNGGNLHLRQDLLVTSFDSGYHQIAPLAFPFEMGNIKDTIYTTPLFLAVYTVQLGNATDIHDVKPPYQAPFTLAEIWLFILIGVGIIMLGLVAWFLIKKYRKEPIFISKRPAEPPHIIALRDLDNLRAEKLWQQNKLKQYYTRLSEIIRTYIEHRYNIIALEMTSDEIIAALKKAIVDDVNSIDLLRKMFTTADLVKFAKMQTLPDENEVNLLNAYQFVNNTKQVTSIMDTENNTDSKQVQQSTAS